MIGQELINFGIAPVDKLVEWLRDLTLHIIHYGVYFCGNEVIESIESTVNSTWNCKKLSDTPNLTPNHLILMEANVAIVRPIQLLNYEGAPAISYIPEAII